MAQRRVLLVASKGVGRVLRQLAGLAPRVALANGELIELRHADDVPSIGMILCRGRNATTVEYSLCDTAKPMSVAGNEQPSAPSPMYRAKAMSVAASDESLPVEAGKGVVTVNLNGTVQMNK